MTDQPASLRPARPALSHVFTITAQVAPPLLAGPGLGGERLHIRILGGTVAGPRLRGTVLPGGSDWALRRPDGASEVTALYSIQAEDGTPIWVRNCGLRIAAPELAERLRAGERVDPARYYFRSTPVFDAPDGPHAWLRDRIFTASLEAFGGQVAIDVYSVD